LQFVLLSVCRSRHGISIPDAIPKRFSISSEFVEFCFSIFGEYPDRIYQVPLGGLIVRIQVDYSREGKLLRYSLSLIDLSHSSDNGRVLGYDNAHGQHHRHCFGRGDLLEFESYEKLEGQFEAQVRQYLETGTF
jgi:hypothetical protein